MNPALAYAGSVDRLWSWQRQAKLSDKELAELAGISPNTVKAKRRDGRLLTMETMYRLRARLGEGWWSMITAPSTNRIDQDIAELRLRLADVEAAAARLRGGL